MLLYILKYFRIFDQNNILEYSLNIFVACFIGYFEYFLVSLDSLTKL